MQGGRWWPVRTAEMATPALDVYKEKDEIVAKIELPGVEKDEVEVRTLPITF